MFNDTEDIVKSMMVHPFHEYIDPFLGKVEQHLSNMIKDFLIRYTLIGVERVVCLVNPDVPRMSTCDVMSER